MKARLLQGLVVGLGLATLAAPIAAQADNTTVAPTATLTMTDSGFSPAAVSVIPGGNITVVNGGSIVHKAIAPGVGTRYDTGDLAPGQSATFQIPSNGTYTFASTTDSLTPGGTPFDQGATANVTVTTASAGSVVSQTTQFTGNTVVLTDAGLLTPTINIQAGQTVSWMNLGDNAHSVVGSAGPNTPFDSGALGDGDAYSVTFNQPGTFNYSSPIDNGSAAFNGSVVVSA